MDKKLKKILASVFAMAMCAVSMTAMTSGAVYIQNTIGITPYTVSFTAGGLQYGVWQEMNDYFDYEDCNFFISENGNSNIALINGCISKWSFCGYMLENDEDIYLLKKYLLDNNIECLMQSMGGYIFITCTNDIYTDDEYFRLLQKIKEDTGLVQGMAILADNVKIEATDIENVLPEPTLTGDSNEDGEVSIADAILIMQSLVNPDEYSLTPQGIANADMNGDGITTLDALSIQEMLVQK